jgi:hypothetical protein
MAEIGLVRFARVALEVAEAALPDYRTKFSPSTPSPRAATFGHSLPYTLRGLDPLRKAEVRLAEHDELRDALGLRKAPDHTPRSTVLCGGSTSRPWLPP